MNRSHNAPVIQSRPPADRQMPAAIESSQLFPAGQNTVFIAHGGQRYMLRLTKENKLILTK